MQHHLAILLPRYLELVLSGRKTVECRLGQRSIPPHGFVDPDDIIWLKQSSGPIHGVAQAGRIRSYQGLDAATVQRLRRDYGQAICAEPRFWRAHRHARYATLIWLEDVKPLPPFRIDKTDRRPWVVLPGPPVPHPLPSPSCEPSSLGVPRT